ncbi:uncharacterized protein EDB93DRAFT_1235100 [Suillus bovinus]|uniref:uncharacterized protein n=1 Tax=Suillus bovinus TaxID=48563 RepID=UPI001B85BCA7|nr:uncharacterized protein EDB93DRAFT_1235100 [Suillus bovinus]KAG2127916.1 hypothetical protein EDB93DRAFT_1235100 [Suillus bovinus]
MTRRRKNTPKQQARTEPAGEAQETDGSPSLSRCAPTTQYHHFIPRFILRRFQVGPVKSKTERQKEFRRTGVDPEYVHYYDIATGSLDIRPIGKVYGVPNFYQDVQNTRNINELEEKLADLERHAASIIMDLHKVLPQGTFTLKRRPLELLRKFLFIMHYRKVSCSGAYFQADHPENARSRQWIESFMKAKGIQSSIGVWLYFLRYYLDTSHSDIMRDAAELVDKYGEEGLLKMITESHIPPDVENYPAYTYHTHANNAFFSIWEAAEGEEFILTHNGFGLWEGLGGGCPGLHRIFVVSPRIAIVLCNIVLRPDIKKYAKPGSLVSSLLHVNPAPATPIYTSGERAIPMNSESAMALARYRSSQEGANDSFVFKITKLSRPQTLEFNSVLLVNVTKTGSLTFLSKSNALRTVRVFRSLPANFLASELLVPLIARLTDTMETEASALRPPLQSPEAVLHPKVDALTLVDVVLYVLLMQICTGSRRFETAYDRAHLVFKIMEKAKPTSFADEINREVEKAFKVCKESEDEMPEGEGISFAPLLSSISDESSSQLFQFMIPYMSRLGAVMSEGEEILEELQDEVTVVSFLARASSSPAVWHTLSCTSPQASEILSRLFKKDTPTDESVRSFMRSMYEHASPSSLSSGFHLAYFLREICGMTGPTTNLISQRYYRLTAFLIEGLGRTMLGSLPEPYSSQPRERPKARLFYKMSEEHSKLLFSNMKVMLRDVGYEPSPGGSTLGQTLSKWVDEMAIVGCLAWLGKHRRNFLDFLLDQFPQGMNLKLFEDEEATGSV